MAMNGHAGCEGDLTAIRAVKHCRIGADYSSGYPTSRMKTFALRGLGGRRRHAGGNRPSGKRGGLHGPLEFLIKATHESLLTFEAKGALHSS